MKQVLKEIAVKNMVCNRCIKVVKDELIKNRIEFNHVDLGVIYFEREVLEQEKEKLKEILEKEGFELVEDREAVIVKKIKTIVVQLIHHGMEKPVNQNFSEFISSEVGIFYPQFRRNKF